MHKLTGDDVMNYRKRSLADSIAIWLSSIGLIIIALIWILGVIGVWGGQFILTT